MIFLFPHRSIRLAGIGVFLCVGLALPAMAGKFSTKCGSTRIPKVDRNGAICLALCGGGSDAVTCIATKGDNLTVESGETSPLQGPASTLWIRILGKRVLKLDIKEFSKKQRDDEGLWKGFDVEIGDGDCGWPAVMAALDDIGYEGWASAEVGGGDRERLLEISQRMDRILVR